MGEGAVSADGRKRLRRVGWIAWVGSLPIAAALALYPVNSGSLRAAFLLLLLAQWAGALVLTWRWKAFRYLLAAPVVLGMAILVLPERAIDINALASRYVQNVKGYEGTPYVWGGEKKSGIDCSGLPRRALMRACAHEGLTHANGALIRKAFKLWSRDASARAMGEEHRGETRFLFQANSINEADHTRLQPGDLAVTVGGVHVLVYVGDRTWMEANPGDGRVVTRAVPSNGGYFTVPVRMMRWTVLQPANP